jgi:hypothetical protein
VPRGGSALDGSLMPKKPKRQKSTVGTPSVPTRKARLLLARGMWHRAARPEHVLLASRSDPILERYLGCAANRASGERRRYLVIFLVIFGFLDFWHFCQTASEAPWRQSAGPHDAATRGRVTRRARRRLSIAPRPRPRPPCQTVSEWCRRGVGVVSEFCWLFLVIWFFGIFAKRRVRLPGGRAPPPTTRGRATRDTANAAVSLHCARPSAAVPNGVEEVSKRWCRRGVGAHTVKKSRVGDCGAPLCLRGHTLNSDAARIAQPSQPPSFPIRKSLEETKCAILPAFSDLWETSNTQDTRNTQVFG